MKLSYNFIPFLIATVIVISGCGASATPTQDPADVQNTAVAAAATVVAETQAALSTATSTAHPTMTLTQTLAPTEAPTQTPILEATFTATATAVATGGNSECNKPLQGLSGGKPAKIKIENNSGFPVTVSLFLNKNAFGDCGYRGYTLTKGGSVLITDLIQGCYSASAIINNPKKPVSAFGYGCINNPDKWSFIVLKDSVSLQGR